MTFPRLSRARLGGMMGASLLACLLLWGTVAAEAQNPANYRRIEDIIYGRKHGVALTLDVFEPARTNGYGVLFMVSGGFFSSKSAINPAHYRPFLDRGYTVFAVVHGSQPKYTIPEIVEDVHRAVRFVRYHAAKWGIRPDKLGVCGASAGGHLSLTLGTQGGPGRPEAADAVDRASSAVQAVACFFPPTDFLNYGKTGEVAVGIGILREFRPAFGPRSDQPQERLKYGREISPIYFITSNLPPTLIIHGDADKLVPIQQAESFVEKAREAGAKAKLIVRPGRGHGWVDMLQDVQLLADWFDEHLRGLKTP
ncbi:alpha/beta hydrolase [Fontisphaera persica]|uniref:alpha/beta hydrolase n=1 Tax=Fontisphaera persica TaxID=2974023 RepID=UPI0024C03CBF|nr:alpha/beta hydrolase [Fontisphaera persica]WCJ59735.1 alpha/beta hydrolase [Fontisphaera persica]